MGEEELDEGAKRFKLPVIRSWVNLKKKKKVQGYVMFNLDKYN